VLFFGIMSRVNLVGLAPSQLEELAVELGASRYRGRQLATWIYRKGVLDLEAMSDLPKDFRAALAAEWPAALPEIERVTREVGVPLLYNFVEHGKSPLLPVSELQGLGFKLVIFPGSIMLAVLTLVRQILGEIKQHGTTAALLDRMSDVVDLFETVGLSEMLALDVRVGSAERTSIS